jgi:hypothetical protein
MREKESVRTWDNALALAMKRESTAKKGARRTCSALGRLAAACQRPLVATFLLSVVFFLPTGCGTLVPRGEQAQSDVMKAVMERNDRIILLSGETLAPDRPVLLLLHGATDDPSEMLAIAGQWAKAYNVFLYSYNFHHSIERLASDLVQELKGLRAMIETLTEPASVARDVTVITYSYSASVFRKAVLLAEDKALFSGVSLIQIVPTAGGSLQARIMENRIAASVISAASKPSAAENPFGSIAEELWDDEGTSRFDKAISPDRVRTLLVEADSHSLANIPDDEVQQRYRNGIGSNVVVIPKEFGVTHENFPNHPVGLDYLKKAIEATARSRWNETKGRSGQEIGSKGQSSNWRTRLSRRFHEKFLRQRKPAPESSATSH